MPKPFEDCVKSGGRVRTKLIGKDKFMRLCFKDGKSFAGETKKRKAQNRGR